PPTLGQGRLEQAAADTALPPSRMYHTADLDVVALIQGAVADELVLSISEKLAWRLKSPALRVEWHDVELEVKILVLVAAPAQGCYRLSLGGRQARAGAYSDGRVAGHW